MTNDIFRQIETEEKNRTDELIRAFNNEEKINEKDIIGNNAVLKELEKGTKIWTCSFSEASSSLPLNSLIYSKVLVSVCPKCTCSTNPNLIKPYLERGLVLPVLHNSLDMYPEDFSNLVIQYPYIGSRAFNLLRLAKIVSSDEEGGMCQKCFGKKVGQIFKEIERINDKKTVETLKDFCTPLFSYLYPCKRPEEEILGSIDNCIHKKKFKNLLPLHGKAWKLANLRNSQVFDAIPQVNHIDILNIDEIIKTNYSSKKGLNALKGKEFALKSLNLDYNPSMPIEEYLDIIIPRRQKINKLIDEFIDSKDHHKHLSKIQEEIWEINNEISSSKSIEMLTWATNIVFDNAKILSSVLIGALIGYSSGDFTGCGIGSAGGLLAGEVLSRYSGKYGEFKVSKYPAKTVEWVKSKVESSEERMMATLLSKDTRAIQIWSLRKKLKKIG